MRTFLLIVASLALAIPALAVPEWAEYRPAGGAFRVEFPGKPSESTKILPDGTPTRSAHLTLNGAVLRVTTSPVSPAVAAKRIDERLDLLRNAEVTATNGKLREEHSVSVNGTAGRRVIIESGSGVALYIELLPTSDTLYQVTYGARAGTEKPEDIARFLDSFGLLKN